MQPLELNPRLSQLPHRARIEDFEELYRYTPAMLSRIPGLGPVRLDELTKALSACASSKVAIEQRIGLLKERIIGHLRAVAELEAEIDRLSALINAAPANPSANSRPTAPCSSEVPARQPPVSRIANRAQPADGIVL